MRTNAVRNEDQQAAESRVTMPGQKPVLTIQEVAEILRCSKTHVSNALNGKIPGTPRLTHFAIGRRKLIRREWLDQWMETNKNE